MQTIPVSMILGCLHTGLLLSIRADGFRLLRELLRRVIIPSGDACNFLTASLSSCLECCSVLSPVVGAAALAGRPSKELGLEVLLLSTECFESGPFSDEQNRSGSLSPSQTLKCDSLKNSSATSFFSEIHGDNLFFFPSDGMLVKLVSGAPDDDDNTFCDKATAAANLGEVRTPTLDWDDKTVCFRDVLLIMLRESVACVTVIALVMAVT